MKVSELIEALRKAKPDAEVMTEGCDCDGNAAFVLVDESGTVMIARPNAYYASNPDDWGRKL